jgi:hypothetical protein
MTLRQVSTLHGLDYNAALQLSGNGIGLVYEQWDADIAMMCYCDYGYTGADCSLGDIGLRLTIFFHS